MLDNVVSPPARLWLGCAAALAVLATGITEVREARAEGGRDFAAFYEISDELDMVSEVSVTLTMDVFNYSGEDIYDAEVEILDPWSPETMYATFHAAYIENGDRARIRGTVTVPAEDYRLWTQGLPPLVSLGFNDASGIRAHAFVEMASDTLLAENEP